MNLETPIQKAETRASRVMTLLFLSTRLPVQLLSEKVGRSLCAETGASVVLVRLTRIGHPATPEIRELMNLVLDGSIRLPAELPRTQSGFCLLHLAISGEPQPAERITSLIGQLRDRFDYVLVEMVADELMTPVLFDFLQHSDAGYLFVQPASEDVYQLDLLLRELRPRLARHNVQLKPALCLNENEEVDGYDALIQRVASPVQVFIRNCPKSADLNDIPVSKINPGGSFQADIRRLAREIGSCLVGLALSSGAAKGLSHIGVIQVLEENGIQVDVVAGSSMGAYVGAAWAFGLDGSALEKMARELESKWAFLSLLDPVFPPRQGFVRGVAVKKRLKRTIGNVRFTELVRPLRVVATNLETLERVVFSSGEVAEAVHASVAVPGICVPVVLNGETYIDGGIVDPLPVDVLREMGVDRVIAVNAIPTSDRIRYCLQAEHELAQMPKKRAREVIRKMVPLGQHLNYFARGNILEILMRSIHGGQIRMAESLGHGADIVLRPQICDDRWLDFRSPGRFIEPGRQIAERHLAEIKTLVERKVVPHENEPVLGLLAEVA